MDTSKVQGKIDALPTGREFDVKTLMGSDWDNVENKQSFGMKFKSLVENGVLKNVSYVRLDNSPRRDIYVRT